MPLKSASVPRSPSSPSSPYPSSTARRTSSQPKSSRQQFSACGACRMRRWGLPLLLYLGGVLIRGRGNRVRCDLKDLPFSSTGTQPQCSNCKERGLKCVFVTSPLSIPPSLDARPSDEFAEVKAVKLLRRGRRLQQVEYVPPPIISSTIVAHLSASRAVYGKTIDEDGGLFTAPTLSPGIIPKLQPEFFSSPFFRRLHIQRQPFSLVHT